ncbi:MAG: carboxypeptidase-like regulatory domain-containing protein [Pyrinomonadaceae bacterium]
MSKFTRPALRLFCLLLLAAHAAPAQTSTSSITGTVTDTSGAVVAGATVTATNEATGVTQTQQTTGAGLYAFTVLPVGTYTIAV